MITFLCAIVLLIAGYFLYGRLVERVFQPDDRPTPAAAHPDGVDYVPMKTWRVFLVQLLNIAGTGPIFGALMGAVFGPVVFLWIVFGSILGGAVHDYMSGMISLRLNGASVSEIVGKYLGTVARQAMRIFSLILLVLLGAVFTTSPAALIARLTPDWMNVGFWIVVILIYYVLATLLPIDKIIGKLYPVFGGVLLLMAAGALLTQVDFNVVWRYFSWSNQTLAMITLWAAAMYLVRHGEKRWHSLLCALPATFMSGVSCTYILMAEEGFRLSAAIAYPVGAVFALACAALYAVKAAGRSENRI